MRGVDDDGVDTSLDKCSCALHGVGCHAYAGCYAKTSAAVLAGVGFVLGFCNVFVCHEPDELAVGVDNRQFLDFVALENVGCLLKVCRRIRGDEVLARHDLADGAGVVAFEAEIAVCDYANEISVFVDYGDTADMILAHHAQGVGNHAALKDGDGIVDHAVFGAFHVLNLACLFLDRHVFVDDSQTAFAGYGNGKLRFCHSVHGGGNKRNVEGDVARESRLQVHFAGKYFGIRWYQKDVVERQTFHFNSVGYK